MRSLIVGLIVLCGTPSGQTDDGADRPGLVEATVGVYGYLTNPQFLYAPFPAVIGSNIQFLMTYTDHEPGLFWLMISDEARPAGPFVSLQGGPLTQLLIGPPTNVIGPMRHDGIHSEFSLRVPDNVALLGRAWFSQAVITGGYIDLSSALGGVIGNYY